MTGTLADRNHQFVLPLAGVGRDDAPVAGGKGANLGELVRAGFPVPDAVVISTAAYAVAVESGGLAATIDAGLCDGDSAAIRAAFATVTLPDGLRAEIVAAYAALGGGPVAVRSSATAEDLPGAAFAGQQDTVLNVHGAGARCGPSGPSPTATGAPSSTPRSGSPSSCSGWFLPSTQGCCSPRTP
jgi:pyruvate,water dikinase